MQLALSRIRSIYSVFCHNFPDAALFLTHTWLSLYVFAPNAAPFSASSLAPMYVV